MESNGIEVESIRNRVEWSGVESKSKSNRVAPNRNRVESGRVAVESIAGRRSNDRDRDRDRDDRARDPIGARSKSNRHQDRRRIGRRMRIGILRALPRRLRLRVRPRRRNPSLSWRRPWLRLAALAASSRLCSGRSLFRLRSSDRESLLSRGFPRLSRGSPFGFAGAWPELRQGPQCSSLWEGGRPGAAALPGGGVAGGRGFCFGAALPGTLCTAGASSPSRDARDLAGL